MYAYKFKNDFLFHLQLKKLPLKIIFLFRKNNMEMTPSFSKYIFSLYFEEYLFTVLNKSNLIPWTWQNQHTYLWVNYPTFCIAVTAVCP